MPPFGRRFLLLGLLICGAFLAAHFHARQIATLFPSVSPTLESAFQLNGEYPGEPSPLAAPLRRWGSHSGSDENTGQLRFGPFTAPPSFLLELSGYPSTAGNALYLELVATGARTPLVAENPGETWRSSLFHVPPEWHGQPVALVAIDAAKAWGGWFALSEPLRGGPGDPRAQFFGTLAAWSLNGLLLAALWCACARMLGPLAVSAPALALWLPLLALGAMAALGYVTFWVYFTDAYLGRIFSSTLLLAAVLAVWRRPASAARTPVSAEFTAVGALAAVIALLYLGALYLYPSSRDFYWTAANRFGEFPADNLLPHLIGQRLFDGANLKERLGDWLASDRPPLQTAWQLLTWPILRALPFDAHAASGTAALWFQLSWIAAVHGLLRHLGFSLLRTAAWIAVLGLTGFFLLHSTFTWPKLSAAAFAVGAFALWVFPPTSLSPRRSRLLGAAFAALAWLSHGGVAFAFLALAPWLVWRCLRGEWKLWLQAGLVFALSIAPWVAYQKFYDPPGNRLLKWHLAGQIEIDARGTLTAIRENYAALPLATILEHKRSNLALQFHGTWSQLFAADRASAQARRDEEFRLTPRAFTWWLLGLACAPFVFWRFARAPASNHDPRRPLVALTAWSVGTILIWCVLIFQPHNAIVHQGALAAMLALFVAFTACLEFAHRFALLPIALLQTFTLCTTWLAPSKNVAGTLQPWPLVCAVVAALILCGVIVRALRSPSLAAPAPLLTTSPRDESAASPFSTLLADLKAWWQTPRLTLWVLVAIAALLYLRKPHALYPAQLWAEDGSIFLTFADLQGLAAIFEPYMGYLHLLPRLIAEATRHGFDPAWWPTVYNSIAFLIWVAVVARVFSPRFDLPGKPWLALAFILGPNTGEILFNITNLQWITAFVLVLQSLIAPPANTRQAATDLAVVVIAGLTGPFVIAFAPLYAWRWWRDRTRGNFLLLAAVGLCAATQAWFILRTGPSLDHQSSALALGPLLSALARRLFVWPTFGRSLALELPPFVVAAIGLLAVGALLVWTLRPHPRRELRARIVLAFAAILFVGVWRTRPDTWPGDNLYFADRYFYIPRVLFAWLLIWEFDALPRFVAWTARLVFLATALVHVPEYRVPTPIDYEWPKHVEPIRQGIPAEIPTLPENWTLEYRGRRP